MRLLSVTSLMRPATTLMKNTLKTSFKVIRAVSESVVSIVKSSALLFLKYGRKMVSLYFWVVTKALSAPMAVTKFALRVQGTFYQILYKALIAFAKGRKRNTSDVASTRTESLEICRHLLENRNMQQEDLNALWIFDGKQLIREALAATPELKGVLKKSPEKKHSRRLKWRGTDELIELKVEDRPRSNTEDSEEASEPEEDFRRFYSTNDSSREALSAELDLIQSLGQVNFFELAAHQAKHQVILGDTEVIDCIYCGQILGKTRGGALAKLKKNVHLANDQRLRDITNSESFNTRKNFLTSELIPNPYKEDCLYPQAALRYAGMANHLSYDQKKHRSELFCQIYAPRHLIEGKLIAVRDLMKLGAPGGECFLCHCTLTAETRATYLENLFNIAQSLETEMEELPDYDFPGYPINGVLEKERYLYPRVRYIVPEQNWPSF